MHVCSHDESVLRGTAAAMLPVRVTAARVACRGVRACVCVNPQGDLWLVVVVTRRTAIVVDTASAAVCYGCGCCGLQRRRLLEVLCTAQEGAAVAVVEL